MRSTQIGQEIRIDIGSPIPLEQLGTHQGADLLDHLREITLLLEPGIIIIAHCCTDQHHT